jgi:hypothetical protein
MTRAGVHVGKRIFKTPTSNSLMHSEVEMRNKNSTSE